ncbi:uncharacterized protein BJ171DRAFT_510537 [Polychytrium aggregatum]|uniref:uncharacterized protein n=1 Tax=Polychytrium aggregatum TaxID=110093 RepID=UPI0022FE70AF|nr:uncharacterized protein BJ171DRAFT_510537 [Polychytrium aggregatum]KAI9203379.1 hypothetical protein BJ171DRAFT_510537 [Polychytrium aggregatum]
MSSNNVDYAALMGWTMLPAAISAGIFAVVDLAFIFYWRACRIPPARRTLFHLVLWATFRTAAMVCRTMLNFDQYASNLTLFIVTELLMSLAMFPLIRITIANLFKVNESVIFLKHAFSEQYNAGGRRNHSTLGRRELAGLKRLQDMTSIVILLVVVDLIAAIIWIMNTPAGTPPDPTAVTMRLGGTWAVAGISWLELLAAGYTLMVSQALPFQARTGSFVVSCSQILIYQSLALTVRTGYKLYSVGVFGPAPVTVPEIIFFTLDLLPELLFALPFLMPNQVEKMEPITDEQKDGLLAGA